jgi:dienelactone hydrolase
MKRVLLTCCVLSACVLLRADQALVLDAKLDDAFWRAARAHTLSPSEPGVPAAMGGEVRAAFCGRHLCLSATLPEPGGKVLARSFGRNPVWAKDLPLAPDLEDLVVFTLRYRGTKGTDRNLVLSVNPWGAYRIEEAGRAIAAAEIPRAAEVRSQGWTVEAAVPASLLELDWSAAPRVEVRADRVRSRRALAPEYRWTARLAAAARAHAPVMDNLAERAPVLGNTDPPLEVGRVERVPPVGVEWNDAAWRDIPEFTLARNESTPRAARHRTRVKWMHDGSKLAVFFHADEPEPVQAKADGRDSGFSGEDHVAVYLATSGSAFIEIAISATGALRDSLGKGPRSMRPDTGWNASIEALTDIRRGHWIASLNIPLDECAAALGETGVSPEWRILVSRYRASRPGEAPESTTLPVLHGATSFYGPVRYRKMLLTDRAPSAVPPPLSEAVPLPAAGLAAEIARLPSNVWSQLERRYSGVRTILSRDLHRRTVKSVLAERKAWEQVKTREDWERFRDERMNAMRESLGAFPPPRPPLDVRVSARRPGRGYRLENVAYQSRPGYYVPANLYLPERVTSPVPAIVIVHSQHYPKTEGELHDSGELWARAGAAVLIMERPGFGERAETNPWFRQGYAARFTFHQQLALAGESLSAWTAWDVIRSVDFLVERPEVDKKRIILIGAVASGGEAAGLAAALDPRVAAVVPYNYDQGHVRVHGDSAGQIAKQFSPWLVAASIAPRKFVRPFEFAWEASEEPDFPELWVDGMSRSEKVWGFYGASDSLAGVQGFGLLRARYQRRSACENVGPEQRESLYPVLERWFGIPWPSAEDRAILPSSLLSTHQNREEAWRLEAQRLRPTSELVSIPPALSAELSRKPLHQVAFEMGRNLLGQARARAQSLDARQRTERLREGLKPMLGDIEPTTAPQASTLWTRALSGAGVKVEAVSLQVEDGIEVPMLLLSPGRDVHGIVVAVAAGGKDRFLKGRAAELATLLEGGVAVCLPDLRGSGETESGDQEYPYGGMVQREFDLARNLLGSRLKDLRTVLAYLRGRRDVGSAGIAIWGESFAPPNPPNLWLDEVEHEVSPQIQRRSEPQGAHLALLAGLYEEDIRAVAAHGGLAGYLSVLENPYTYTPSDVTLRGILKAGDIADIAAALAPRALALTGLVGGRNILASAADLETTLSPARQAYQASRAADRLAAGKVPSGGLAAWLLAALR